MLSRIWRTSSGEETIPPNTSHTGSSRKSKEKAKVSAPVEELHDGQPLNPYTEIQLLIHHTDIIRHLVVVDDHSFPPGSDRRDNILSRPSSFVSAGDDGGAVVWDVNLGRKLMTLQGHTRPITCMLILSRPGITAGLEDTYLLTTAADRFIKVWDLKTGECVHSIKEHNSYVRCLISVTTEREETVIISGGEKICLWNKNCQLLNTEELDEESGPVNFMISIKFDGLVAALEKRLVVYHLTYEPDPSSTDPVTLPRLVVRARLLPHRESITSLVNITRATFASGSLDGTIVLWGAHTLSRFRSFNSKPVYQDIAKSYPYSIQHIFCAEEHYIFVAIGCGFCVYDTQGQILAQKINAHYSKIQHMTFVYNGTFLATCSEDGSIRLWTSNKCLRTTQSDDARKMGLVERFLGFRKEEFHKLRADNSHVEPMLAGECLGHSGTVLNLVDFGAEGFVSCGIDNLIILWRDGVVQSSKRTSIARDLLIGAAVSL